MSITKRILVTGGAGFIGSHLVDSLIADQFQVVVIDNFDDYYDMSLKRQNSSIHLGNAHYKLLEGDIADSEFVLSQAQESFDCIVHLAAKAGVRPSIKKPVEYQEVNVKGTQNLLELARQANIKQFIFASSSSVYGVNPNVPWKESDHVLAPISPYASTKVSGELLGHVYSHLYGIRFLALRFFTVYGPRQRPDLAINKFARKILSGEEIPVFGDGSTRRDYTYVGDIVQGIRLAMNYQASSYEIINIGNGRTVRLSEMIDSLEKVLGKKAIINRLPEQPGDVPQTYADISKGAKLLGYAPQMEFEDGLKTFKSWMLEKLSSI